MNERFRFQIFFAVLLALVSPRLTAQTRNLTVIVLVNSHNPDGYNPDPANPGDFEKYPKLYLDHLQVPYELIDTATNEPPADLMERQLILAGHSGLKLSPAWQKAIVLAVQGGTGFVNLDNDGEIGRQEHIQTIFHATRSYIGQESSTISVPLDVIPGGRNHHYITALQRRIESGQPAFLKTLEKRVTWRFIEEQLTLKLVIEREIVDGILRYLAWWIHFGQELREVVPEKSNQGIVYRFHPNASGAILPITATVLSSASGTVIARLGRDPLIVATTYGSGRAVYFGSHEYLKADRFGFVQGLDDLFWRSLVWAAHKPFVVRGYPRFLAIQLDDTRPGWGFRVRDLYNQNLTGTIKSDGTGGPWRVTGYVYTENLAPGSQERASVIADIKARKLQIAPHANGDINLGDLYWNAGRGALSDEEWQNKIAAIQAWREGRGGNDAIPFFSRAFVAHFWDLSDNTGYDLWHALGFRYITSIQRPGFQNVDRDPSRYGGRERLHAAPFWIYAQPPKNTRDEDYPFFFADDYVVKSRAGLPAQNFLLFASQDIQSRYPRPDFIWPSWIDSMDVSESLTQLDHYTWIHWSGLSPVQIYTHDSLNYMFSSLEDRRALIARASSHFNRLGVRHLFMQGLGDYIYARTKSRLARAYLRGGDITCTFDGTATDADGNLIPTDFLVFTNDSDGIWQSVPGFRDGFVATFPVPSSAAAPQSSSFPICYLPAHPVRAVAVSATWALLSTWLFVSACLAFFRSLHGIARLFGKSSPAPNQLLRFFQELLTGLLPIGLLYGGHFLQERTLSYGYTPGENVVYWVLAALSLIYWIHANWRKLAPGGPISVVPVNSPRASLRD